MPLSRSRHPRNRKSTPRGWSRARVARTAVESSTVPVGIRWTTSCVATMTSETPVRFLQRTDWLLVVGMVLAVAMVASWWVWG